jgi:hypothetical protein
MSWIWSHSISWLAFNMKLRNRGSTIAINTSMFIIVFFRRCIHFYLLPANYVMDLNIACTWLVIKMNHHTHVHSSWQCNGRLRMPARNSSIWAASGPQKSETPWARITRKLLRLSSSMNVRSFVKIHPLGVARRIRRILYTHIQWRRSLLCLTPSAKVTPLDRLACVMYGSLDAVLCG